MNAIIQFLAADPRFRILAQLTCAPYRPGTGSAVTDERAAS
ncbi:hypothetical protein [Nocardioides silvaticus]|nr:hypothetical protein [Nocardioides silvaticus]